MLEALFIGISFTIKFNSCMNNECKYIEPPTLKFWNFISLKIGDTFTKDRGIYGKPLTI